MMNASTVSQQPGTPTQLDAAALGRLRELDPDGRHGVLQRVLRAYESSLQRTLGQLQAGAGPADAPAIAALAHTLKSSSASVGALQLAAVCADVEARLRSGDVARLREDVEQMSHQARLALGAVEAILRA
jgi:HPt (histidine-containing phosphotransfer) domain-containing protein